MTYEVIVEGCLYRLDLGQKDDRWRCLVNGHDVAVDPILVRPNVLSLIIGGVSYEVKEEKTPSATYLWIGSTRYRAEVRDPRSLQSRRAAGAEEGGARKVVAPMPGKVVRILVKEHDVVQAGQGVAVVEAMKMQNELRSPKQGTVQRVAVVEGASVNAGDVLLVVE